MRFTAGSATRRDTNDDMEGDDMTTTDTVDDTAAIEALAIRFAMLQAEHANRSEEEACRVSCEAIRSWGERVPAALDAPPRKAK
jgi:hypothetical protein